ncbi:MAG: hypothetical protein LBK96_01785 [Prevotellaceae bacterium]|jgi:hypothetical protein|nr:hypothetical protein [Prevotellaceae bacterium]
MKRTLILSLAVSLSGIAGFSQNIDRAKLDAYFDTLAGNNRFMGSISVSHNNDIETGRRSVQFREGERKLNSARRSLRVFK